MNIRNILFYFFLLAFFLCACKDSGKVGDFVVLPSPQEFKISGVSELAVDDIKSYFLQGANELPVRGPLLSNLERSNEAKSADILIEFSDDIELKNEGYLLAISTDQVNITAKDEAGLFYAFMTLEQLLEDAKEQEVNLPISYIRDYPLLAYRAVHIDVKHHTEKRSYYFELMDRLAKYKVNAIIAEVEDKIAYVRQPKIASSDAFTIEEWIDLCDYAKARNIEISPLVQGLGHASFILKHEEYKHLRDDPASDWAFNPLDPKTYEVQFDLYLDAIQATPHGKYLHVGGDEVHTTGRGSGKSALELQLIWLDKVCKFAADHNRTPIFWDDMPLKHADVYRPMFDRKISKQKVDSIWSSNEHKLLEFIDQFPKNCIYMRWNYQTPETYGNLKAMQWFTENGFQVMGATAGQTRWSLMPQEESNLNNIKSFSLSSIDKGLNGLLLTLWDDDSPHFELYMRGIMGFAEYTWAGEKRNIKEVKAAFRHRAFGHKLAGEEHAFIDQLEAPVGFWKNALLQDKKSRNNLRKIPDPINTAAINLPDEYSKGQWSIQNSKRINNAVKTYAISDSITAKINYAKANNVRNDHTLDVYEQVNNLVKFSMKTLVLLDRYDKLTAETDSEPIRKEILALPAEFQKVRSELEEVYSRTRILEKPNDYILDQDHHTHNANQSLNFDWQVYPEILLMKKIETLRKENLLINQSQE